MLSADAAAGVRDVGILPLAHFVDEGPSKGVAVTLEQDATGTIRPVLYVRRAGAVTEYPLPPHPLHDYSGEEHRREVTARVAPVV